MKLAALLVLSLANGCVPTAIATVGAGAGLIAYSPSHGCAHACPEGALAVLGGATLIVIGGVALAILTL